MRVPPEPRPNAPRPNPMFDGMYMTVDRFLECAFWAGIVGMGAMAIWFVVFDGYR